MMHVNHMDVHTLVYSQMCKVYQKKHLNLWSTCFLLTEIIYSFLKRFEDTKEDIESCKSRDGQYIGQKKKGRKQT